MANDKDLVKLIEKLREPAARSFQHEYVAPNDRPNDVLSIWDVAKPLMDAMNMHPEFAKPSSKFFLGKQLAFFNREQSTNLLRFAVHNGAAEALAWYRRINATESAKMRVVGQVFGLFLRECHTFTNGVTLLPVSKLPDSPNSLSLKKPIYLGPGTRFPVAVMVELDDVKNEDHTIGHERFLEISEMMRRTITAFVLAGDAAPAMAESWQEFVDPELEAAEFGRGWMRSFDEGQLPNHGANVTDESLNWVEKYLQLPPAVATACDVPLARLNLANRRVSSGDKAIDGSICLEALLSGRSRGELTHRLSVRVALLLGHSLDERQKIAKKVRDFYALRSNVVHGNAGNKETTSRKVADEGLALCLAALREIVTHAQLPDPELWELTGGPLWNRYTGTQVQP